jgi:hypothetical protein
MAPGIDARIPRPEQTRHQIGFRSLKNSVSHQENTQIITRIDQEIESELSVNEF